jgi:hypothetical protein
MDLRQGITGLAGLLWAIAPAAAQSDAYCAGLQELMQPNQLYLATCSSGPNCLTPVTQDTALKDKAMHRFAYRTGATGVRNSLVVVQLKYAGTPPADRVADVKLTRYPFDFACYRRSRDHVQSAIPADPENPDRASSVSYRSYDEFHRYGYTNTDNRQKLSGFHTRYFNGERCVTTTDPDRRAQFLFERRDAVAGGFSSVWRRVAGDGTALAGVESNDMRRYEQLHVVLSNYKKRALVNGCFSFAMRAQGGAVEIGLSDIEENVAAVDKAERYRQQTWTLTVH